MKTLRDNGTVLMPVDSAGRVLEILMCLDQYWAQNRLTSFPVAFLTNVSFNTIEFAKSQLGWMSDSVMNAFDLARENPFAFKYFFLFTL
jgi:cleavage and polyadenylation specificity factor subunit 2